MVTATVEKTNVNATTAGEPANYKTHLRKFVCPYCGKIVGIILTCNMTILVTHKDRGGQECEGTGCVPTREVTHFFAKARPKLRLISFRLA